MQTRELAVPGAFELTPQQHGDDRGTFLEWFRADVLEALTGRSLELAQANTSVSAAGTVRGIHFAQVPPGQAKYVTCLRGAVLDVVVDLRVGSPTYGSWDAVPLDDVARRCVFLPEGLGHAFMALADDTVVSYLCSAPYTPEREHVVHPLDPEVGIDWPRTGRDGASLTPLLSPRDQRAPGLADVAASGLLPTAQQTESYVAGLSVRR